MTGNLNAKITIVDPPKYGTFEEQSPGVYVYESTLNDPTSTVVDVVTYTFTNLSGAVVVDRREFILAQEGDVPKLIQTGQSGSDHTLWFGFGALILLLVMFFSSRKKIVPSKRMIE